MEEAPAAEDKLLIIFSLSLPVPISGWPQVGSWLLILRQCLIQQNISQHQNDSENSTPEH